MPFPPCKKCDPDGLKILPTLYAALPASVTAALPAGVSGKKVIENPLNNGHHYGLRILRDGYLYLIYASGPRGTNYPEAYRVVRNGTVIPLPIPAPSILLPEPACRRNGHELRASTITIEKPSECGELFIAFSEHRWSDDTLNDYLGDIPKRRERMQSFFPATWVKTGVYEHAAVATQANIEKVVEYAPAFRPKQLAPDEHAISPLSRPYGTFDADKLKIESTRYPVHQRYDQAFNLAAFMKGESAGPPGHPYPPMLLALWDGIGITHELNGFRNDAGSMLNVYIKERALQLDAMQCINSAKAAMESKARNSAADQTEQDIRGYRATQNRSVQYDSNAFSPEQKAENQKRADANVAAFIKQRTSPVAQKEAEQESKEAVIKADAKWASSYQTLLAGGYPSEISKMSVFSTNFDQFQTALTQLQATRTPDVVTWLKAPLFLATLHDYHETNLLDGLAFEGVIAEAIWGLPSEESGKLAVLDLIEKIDPTHPESIFWRAYAFNQKSAKDELKSFLAQIVGHKATPMDSNGGGWAAFMSGMKVFKTFTKLRGKMDKVSKHAGPTSATEAFVKSSAIDRLIIVANESLFKWLGISKVGAGVGAALVNASLMLRVGITQADVNSITQTKALVDPRLQMKLQTEFYRLSREGVAPAHAYVRAAQNLASDADGQRLRAKWAALSASEAGESVNVSVRIGGTLAIIELITFGDLLFKADKTGKDYALLVATGFAAVSASLQGSTAVATALAEDAVHTLANLKALTGYFAGMAAGIGAVLDIGAFASNKKSNMLVANLYLLKGALGLLQTATYLLTALSSSAPLVARITGRQSVMFLGKLSAGIAGAEAEAKALGAKQTAELVAKATGTAMSVAAKDAGVELGERAALMFIGRSILALAGWQVTVAIILIQGLIWAVSKDDLQKWLETSSFGIAPDSDADPKKQHRAFEKVLTSMGFEADGGPA